MAEKIIKEFYVIKYALSAGGKVTKQRLEVSNLGGMDGRYAYGPNFSQYVVDRDCFEKWDDAVAAFEAAKTKKLASLKKQLAKLEKLQIKKPD